MSKFKNFSVSGGVNQFGDNNTQYNTTNNHHHHNNNGQSSNGDEVLPLAIGAVAGFAALIWWFFSHINQVYYYLNILTLSSSVFAVFSIVILLVAGAAEKEDYFRLFGSIFFAVALFGLAVLSRDHAPNDVIQLSQQTKFMDFWKGLTEHGKDIVISNFISAITIALSAFIAHLASLRQFSYALANPDGKGFWYRLYSSTGIFKMRISFALIAVLSGLVWAALNGKLPNINT